MAYVKQGFTSGQILKAEHLNHIEDGIENAGGGGGLQIVNIDQETFICEKTATEIAEMSAKEPVFTCLSGQYVIVTPMQTADGYEATANAIMLMGGMVILMAVTIHDDKSVTAEMMQLTATSMG